MVVIIEYPSPYPPTQPLPRLEDFLIWVLRQVAPPTPDPKSFAWDAAKLQEIKDKFKPYAPESGMGCMQACYDVLGILYGDRGGKLRAEVIESAYGKARDFQKANPQEFNRRVEAVKVANPNFNDVQARQEVMDQLSSPHNTSDHLFERMHDQGLAGERVHTENKGAEQAIRDMTGNAAGVYVYGMAVNDHHTVTLAVERAADGTQKMYWMDQHNPGLRTEIKEGKLGATLDKVWGGTHSTNIYAFRPPASGTP